jgi:riboflavin synthase
LFTGVIQAVGVVASRGASQIAVSPPKGVWEDPFRVGESIAVNGCCLTLAVLDEDLTFELSEETLRRTSLGALEPGDLVNLERALRPFDRMGGHIVQGHVDAIGELFQVTPGETQHVFRFGAPEGFDRYLVDKGSVAVEGISLTVVRPSAGAFDTFIVPHTYENTNLRTLQHGDPVNMEFDVLSKYVERLVGR